MLGRMDGFDVVREVRRSHDLPIIVVSARADTHDIVAALEAGADDYVTKPFQVKEITARLRALRRRAGAATGPAPPHDRPAETVLDRDPDAAAGAPRGSAAPCTAASEQLPLTRHRVPAAVRAGGRARAGAQPAGAARARLAARLLRRRADRRRARPPAAHQGRARSGRPAAGGDGAGPGLPAGPAVRAAPGAAGPAGADRPGLRASAPSSCRPCSWRRPSCWRAATCSTSGSAAATRQAFVDANLLRSRLWPRPAPRSATSSSDLVPSGGADVVVRSGGAWFSSAWTSAPATCPATLRATSWTAARPARCASPAPAGPHLVVGVPGRRGRPGVLRGRAARRAAAGAAHAGRRARRRRRGRRPPRAPAFGVLGQPSGGRSRWNRSPARPPGSPAASSTPGCPAPTTPTWWPSSASFNSMVDALAARIERDARFVGDVSHELRSPLTTPGHQRRGARRPPRGAVRRASRQALTLVEAQLAPLPRAPSTTCWSWPGSTATRRRSRGRRCRWRRLVREVRRPPAGRPACCTADADAADHGPRRTSTASSGAVRNLLDNADRHAGGRRAVRVERRDDVVAAHRRRRRAGVPPEDRERVFERFARGAAAPRAARCPARGSAWRSWPRPPPARAARRGARAARAAAPGSPSPCRRRAVSARARLVALAALRS